MGANAASGAQQGPREEGEGETGAADSRRDQSGATEPARGRQCGKVQTGAVWVQLSNTEMIKLSVSKAHEHLKGCIKIRFDLDYYLWLLWDTSG